MKDDHESGLIDDMASDLLCLDGQSIDIPTTGKFLNQMEIVIKEAEGYNAGSLKRIAGGLTILLEKAILDSADQKEVYHAFEKGITVMQKIANGLENTGGYDRDIEECMKSINALAHVEEEETESAPGKIETSEEEHCEETGQEEKFEIQDESLLRDFITEGLEYIGEIEAKVLNLEQSPEDKDYINAVFRPFHSIKGVASFLDLGDICDLAHDLETLLDRARSDELPVDSSLIDVILDGSDALKAMIGSLKEVLDGEKDRPLKLDLSALKNRIKNIDQQVASESEIKKLGDILVGDGVITEEELEESLKTAQKTPSKKIGETLIEEGKATPGQVSKALRKQAEQITDTGTIRVDIKKLDNLVDMIGEMVITQSMIKQNPMVRANADRKLIADISQLSSITSELQRTSTSLRMIPIRQTFQRMSRLVRDLARNAGKLVVVRITGEDTEIDRNMVEEIYNPLVHMIRNSVDHGIETPEERIKLGKPDNGLIQLKAYHKGGNIVIEITDDGRGLNKENILKKAINEGLVNGSNSLTDQEIYNLLFLPGFSTAEEVTDISGRGVGMDVVKQAVEKLRGKIEVNSIAGESSTFTMHFPLTMAIIDGMIVRVGCEKYIIPVTAIRQLLRPLREAYNNVAGKGEMLKVMDNLLPLVRLHEVFDVEAEHKNPWEALVVVVVVESESRSKCLLVDEVTGKEEVVIKGFGDGLKDIKGVSGGAILGDGNVGLILDPEGIFALSEN